jgi:hypothetical protein
LFRFDRLLWRHVAQAGTLKGLSKVFRGLTKTTKYSRLLSYRGCDKSFFALAACLDRSETAASAKASRWLSERIILRSLVRQNPCRCWLMLYPS